MRRVWEHRSGAVPGFTRRYGGSIAARIGVVGRDGLDACVYVGTTAPRDKAPPPSRGPTTLPGEEYESAAPPPPVEDVDSPPIEEPLELNETTPVEEVIPDAGPSPVSESIAPPPANEAAPTNQS